MGAYLSFWSHQFFFLSLREIALPNLLRKGHCHYKSYRLIAASLDIFYEEKETFMQIKQQELILSPMVTNYQDDRRQPCQ